MRKMQIKLVIFLSAGLIAFTGVSLWISYSDYRAPAQVSLWRVILQSCSNSSKSEINLSECLGELRSALDSEKSLQYYLVAEKTVLFLGTRNQTAVFSQNENGDWTCFGFPKKLVYPVCSEKPQKFTDVTMSD